MARSVFANNAFSTLSAGINNAVTSLVVQTGEGARFPTLSGTDFFWCTLDDGVNVEIVKVTARATDTFTIVRAQQGTGAQAFSSGTTKVQLRWTSTDSSSVGGSDVYTIDSAGHLDANGEIIFDHQSSYPATPAANKVSIFAKHYANKMMPLWIAPTGIIHGFQPGLFHNNIELVLPNTSTTVPIAYGNIPTARNSGTAAAQSTPSPASTNLLTSLNRINFGTGSTATGTAGLQGGRATVWRGNAAGLGGFLFSARIALETVSGTYGFMVGLSALNAALASEPSVQNNTLAFGFDSTDANWQFISRDGTTTTKANSGVAYTVNDVVDVYIYCKPNDTHVYCSAFKVNGQNSGTAIFTDQDITANLPSNTTFLFPWCVIRSATGTTAKLCALMGWYIEKFPGAA